MQAASSWLCIYPRGLRELLVFIKKEYNNPVLYVTENGNTSIKVLNLSFQILYAYCNNINKANENLTKLIKMIGVDEFNDPTLSLEEALIDTYRLDYYYRHLYYVQAAIK